MKHKSNPFFHPARFLAVLTLVFAAVPAHAVSHYWEGGTADLAGTGNAASAGGTGTWDTTIKNWDPAPSGTAYAAWPNSANSNVAFFGGSGGTVTLGANVGATGAYPNAINVTAGNYVIDQAGFDLSFRGTAITISSGATLDLTNGTITLQNTGAMTVTGTNGLKIHSKVTGGGGIAFGKGGAGDLLLYNDANDFTGKLYGANGGSGVYITSIKNSGVASAAGSGTIVETSANNAIVYTGSGDSTNRTFSITGGGDDHLKSSGPTGPLIWTGPFANTKTVAATLHFAGSNTSANEFGAGLANNLALSLSVAKDDAGTWKLSGINTHTGNTTINGGKLQFAVGGSSANSTVILANATATAGVSISDNTKTWTGAALTTTTAGFLEFSFGAVTPSTTVKPLSITGAAAFTVTPKVRVVVDSGLAIGTYPLMTWGSTSGTAPTTAGLTVSTMAAATAATLSVSGNTLNLVISSGPTTFYWDNNGTTAGFGVAGGTWTAPTISQWSADATGVAAPVASVTSTTADPVNFGNAATGLGAGTIAVSGTVSSGNMTFATGSGEIVLAGGAINFPATGIITVNNTTDTISSGLAGAATSLTKAGTGTLLLPGLNTYSGVTTISAGTLTAANAASLGATSGHTIVSSGATLRIQGGLTIAEPLNITGSGIDGAGAIKSAGNNTLTGAVTSSGGRLQTEGLDTLTLTGGITGTSPNTVLVGDFIIDTNPINVGANGIIFAGDGDELVTGKKIVLNAAGNNWDDALLFFSAIVKLGASNVMPVGASVRFGWTTVGNSTSTLDLNGFNQTVATIETTTSPVVSPGGDIRITGGGILTVNQSAALKEFTGVISDGATATALVKTGVGTLILSGANTYTGDTTVSMGVLAISATGSLSDSSAVKINTGGILDLATGINDTVRALVINGGAPMTDGTYGSSTSGAANVGLATPDDYFAGDGIIIVNGGGITYASWAATHAGGQTAGEDFDNDGVDNGVEFFMNAPAGFTANPALNGSNQITWTNGGNLAPAAYGTQYVVQTSSDLVTWVAVPSGSLTTNSSGPGGSLTYTLSGTAPRFVRLKVTP